MRFSNCIYIIEQYGGRAKATFVSADQRHYQKRNGYKCGRNGNRDACCTWDRPIEGIVTTIYPCLKLVFKKLYCQIDGIKD